MDGLEEKVRGLDIFLGIHGEPLKVLGRRPHDEREDIKECRVVGGTWDYSKETQHPVYLTSCQHCGGFQLSPGQLLHFVNPPHHHHQSPPFSLFFSHLLLDPLWTQKRLTLEATKSVTSLSS